MSNQIKSKSKRVDSCRKCRIKNDLTIVRNQRFPTGSKIFNKKSQFYLFTSLLLIGIVLSYFSLPFIIDKNKINQNEDFLNIYKQGQRAYNIGFETIDFLSEYENIYSQKNSEDMFNDLEELREVNNELIFGNKGIKNLVKFTSEVEAYQFSKNRKTKLIWFVKKRQLIGTKKMNSYYVISNSNLKSNDNFNFRLVDSNSNVFYFYDSNSVDNDKTIETKQFKNEQIDVYTLCDANKCIVQYETEQNSLGLLKNNTVQINKINANLELPVYIFIFENKYTLGEAETQEVSSLFGMIEISSDNSGENIATVIYYS